jgi:hypothetical protein
MAFEPEIGTLTALEREFSRRLTRRLRAVQRGSTSSLFEKHPEREDSLMSLGGQIIELSGKLEATERSVKRVACDYLFAYLRERHGEASADAIGLKKTATELLAKLAVADVEHE